MPKASVLEPAPTIGDLLTLLRGGLGVGVSQEVEFRTDQSYRLPDGRHGMYLAEERMGGALMLKFRVETPGRPPAIVWQPRDRVAHGIVEARSSDLTDRLMVTLRQHADALTRVGLDGLSELVRRICSWQSLQDAGIADAESGWAAFLALRRQCGDGIAPQPGRIELQWLKGQPTVMLPPEVRAHVAALNAHVERVHDASLRIFVAVTARLLSFLVAEFERTLVTLVERQRRAVLANDPMKLTAFSRSGLQEVARAPLLEAGRLLKLVDVLHYEGRDWHIADLVEPDRGIVRILVRAAIAAHALPDASVVTVLQKELAYLEHLRTRLLKRFPELTLEQVVDACYAVRGAASRVAARGVPAFTSFLAANHWRVTAAAETLNVPPLLFEHRLRWLGILRDFESAALVSQWEALGEPSWHVLAAEVHVDADVIARTVSRIVIDRDFTRVSKDLDQRLVGLLEDAERALSADERTTRYQFPFDAPRLAKALGIHRLTAAYILEHYHLEERWADLRPTTTREVDRITESMPNAHRVRETLLRTRGQLAPAAKSLRMSVAKLEGLIGRYALWRYARRVLHGDE